MIQRIFRLSLVLVVLLAAAILIGGFMSPSQWRSEASVKITAPISNVYAQVNTLKQWSAWTPWPNVEISYSGPESGVGARYQWYDGAMHGEMAIMDAQENRAINYSMITNDGEFEVDCGFEFMDGQQVTVQWACWGDSGSNPVARLMMKLYEPTMRKDLELGLQQLKTNLEVGA